MVAQGLVFIGSTNDEVVALNGTTGASKWSCSTGGSITATPALLGSTLIVGSADGDLYHFAALTGVETLTPPYGSPISGLALAAGIVMVTSSNETLGARREPTGIRVAWNYTGAGELASAPVVLNAMEATEPPRGWRSAPLASRWCDDSVPRSFSRFGAFWSSVRSCSIVTQGSHFDQ